MQHDALIKRRFEELVAKAEEVSATRRKSARTGSVTIPPGPFHAWATSAQNLLVRVVGVESVHYRNFTNLMGDFAGYESTFEGCRAVFAAAQEDYLGGYLFNLRALVKAEVLADAFAQARELLKAGYKDPACVVCRVALEVVLKELAGRHAIALGKLDRMNADLCKAGVYNMVKQKQITAWADIGNKAAHGQWDEYDEQDARAMLDGVEVIVADLS